MSDAQVKATTDATQLKAALDAAQAAYDRVVSPTTSSTTTSTSTDQPLTSVATQADIDQAKVALTQAQAAYDDAVRVDQSAIASAADQVKVAKLTLSEAQAPPDLSGATTARDNAKQAHDAAVAAYAAVLAGSGPTVAQGEVVFAPSLPARVQSAVTSLGALDAGGAGEAASGGGRAVASGGGAAAPSASGLVTLAAGRLVVATTLHPGDVGLVRTGMGVELLDETTSTAYQASVSAISARLTAGSDGQLGYAAVVAADPALPASLAGANVRVTITAAATSGEVLVVPLAAVSSSSGGQTRVSLLRSGSSEPVDVAVTAGLSADGFVAVDPVAGASLAPGDEVVVGR